MVKVTPQAKSAIKQASKQLGSTELHAASELFLWFHRQPQLLKLKIVGLIPEEHEADIAGIILREMRRRGKQGDTP